MVEACLGYSEFQASWQQRSETLFQDKSSLSLSLESDQMGFMGKPGS